MARTLTLPRSVLVLGQRFTVHTTADLQTAHPDQERMVLDVLGLCDSDDQVIVLEKNQPYDKMAETFLHENLHAIIAAAGLRDEFQGDMEERVVKRVAPIMLDWLRRNPAVYTALTGRYTRGRPLRRTDRPASDCAHALGVKR